MVSVGQLKHQIFTMKLHLSLAALAAIIGLGGCGSNAGETGVSPAERAQQLKSDTSIPAPAQARVDEQIAAKQKMDAMRAQDAANAPKAP